MSVVHEEYAFSETGQRLLHLLAVELALRTRGHPLQPLQQTGLVALRLQTADEPRPGVGQTLVVEVDRVLGGQQDTHPKGSGLLEQGKKRPLGRRFGDRREEAEDLVHIDDGPQASGTLLGPHPAEDLVQEQRYEEHALRVGEMSDGEDRDPGLAIACEKHLPDVQRLALEPGLEGRGREQIVEKHGQFEPRLGRIEGIQIEDSHFHEGRCLDLLDEAGKVEVLAGRPSGVEQTGKQDVLPALDRIRRNSHQTEEAGDRRVDAVPQRLIVGADRRGRGGERLEDAHRQTRVRSGRVDGEFGRVSETLDPARVLSPVREPFFPHVRLLRGEVIDREGFLGGFLLADPRAEILGTQQRERQHQVGHVSLGVDDDGRNTVDGRFFQKADTETGLSAPSHAHAYAVRD